MGTAWTAEPSDSFYWLDWNHARADAEGPQFPIVIAAQGSVLLNAVGGDTTRQVRHDEDAAVAITANLNVSRRRARNRRVKEWLRSD